jgi:hypothetical protein
MEGDRTEVGESDMKRRKRGKQTLKRKMLSILLLCAMSCILAVVIVSYMTIRMIRNDSIQESMQIYLEQITREIDSDYYDMIGIIGKGSGNVWKTFFKVCIPILTSSLLWAVSLPMQTAILGHLSADAIAANSVSSTFFQYLKVIVIAIAGASAVVIGKDIGSNDEEKVRCNGRTLSVLYLAIGLLLGTVLFLLLFLPVQGL